VRKTGKFTGAAAVAALFVVLAGNVRGAGMGRPMDFRADFNDKKSFHPYYTPSNFEQIDMLTGRNYMVFSDVSLPGEGSLSLEIIRDYSRKERVYSGDIFVYAETAEAQGATRWISPFGVNWEVMREYLGEDYWSAFKSMRSAECEAFHARISNVDYEWYLRAV